MDSEIKELDLYSYVVIKFQYREVSTTQKESPLKYCQKTLKKLKSVILLIDIVLRK